MILEENYWYALPPKPMRKGKAPRVTKLFQITEEITKIGEDSGYPDSSVGMMLASLVCCNKPATILEIGYNLGYSALWLCAGSALCEQKAKVLSVDIRECDGGEVVRSMGFDNHVFLQGDSHQVRPQVEEILGPEIDFLFLDGKHDYESLSGEWKIYSPMISACGFAVLHDLYATQLQKVVDEIGPEWNVTYLGGWASLSLVRKDKYHQAHHRNGH